MVSLDISEQALEMAKDNALLNKLEANHKVLAGDAFEKMEQLSQQNKKFDIVVVDPPSFAKRDSERDRAIRSYGQLTKLAIKLVAKNGLLVMASCSSRVSADEFFRTVTYELERSNKKFEETNRTFHDVDHPIGFPEGAYLKCGYFQLNS